MADASWGEGTAPNVAEETHVVDLITDGEDGEASEVNRQDEMEENDVQDLDGEGEEEEEEVVDPVTGIMLAKKLAKKTLVVCAIDDAKYYESISKITNPMEREELKRYYSTDLVSKRIFFDKLADADELAKAVLRLGRLLIQHGKPFSNLRKLAKELVSIGQAAYKAADEAIEIDDEQYEQLKQLKIEEYQTTKAKWDGKPPSQRGATPRHREPARNLLCFCFRSQSNSASDGGSCPSCTVHAESREEVDYQNCVICQWSCFADWRVSDISKIALAAVNMVSAGISNGISSSSSSSSIGVRGGDGDLEYNLAWQLVEGSEEYQQAASRYWDIHRQDLHKFAKDFDHSHNILLQFMASQDLDLQHRRKLQKTLGSPSTKGDHADGLRASAAVPVAVASATPLVAAVTEMDEAGWESSVHLLLQSGGDDSTSNLHASGADSSMLQSAGDSGWESGGGERDLQEFAGRIVVRGKKRLVEPQVDGDEKVEVQRVRKLMTVQSEDTKTELKGLLRCGNGSEEGLAYFMDDLE
ncbi:hypothetical protein B484DRAFT_399358 [Ochromonadaceae sp. CCMP2298]|nr:hypothetical protein B484DRAFT_399358 [Ochromonadaceae sp. CCMP2298]